MKATSFAAFALMAALPYAEASTPDLNNMGVDYYDQQFVMSPLTGSGDSLQDKHMKELFEVPENPWYVGNGGHQAPTNHRHGKALSHGHHPQRSASSRVEYRDRSHEGDSDYGYGLLLDHETKRGGHGIPKNFFQKSQAAESLNFE